jgi:hypothetical protein
MDGGGLGRDGDSDYPLNVLALRPIVVRICCIKATFSGFGLGKSFSGLWFSQHDGVSGMGHCKFLLVILPLLFQFSSIPSLLAISKSGTAPRWPAILFWHSISETMPYWMMSF